MLSAPRCLNLRRNHLRDRSHRLRASAVHLWFVPYTPEYAHTAFIKFGNSDPDVTRMSENKVRQHR